MQKFSVLLNSLVQNSLNIAGKEHITAPLARKIDEICHENVAHKVLKIFLY